MSFSKSKNEITIFEREWWGFTYVTGAAGSDHNSNTKHTLSRIRLKFDHSGLRLKIKWGNEEEFVIVDGWNKAEFELDVQGGEEKQNLAKAFRFIADILDQKNQFDKDKLEYLVDTVMGDEIKIKKEDIEYI